MAVTGSEEAEITRRVDLYVEGMRNGDGAKLREAFHPQAWMFGSLAGTRYQLRDRQRGESFAQRGARDRAGVDDVGLAALARRPMGRFIK